MRTAGQGSSGVAAFEDVQARTFCKWLNTKLDARQIAPMTDLSRDLCDGTNLIQLMEIMGDASLGRYNRQPRLRVQRAENVNLALQFISSRGVTLTNIGPEDVVDGNLKLILGLIWTLILRFTIADISEEGVTAKEGLLLWCQRKTRGYKEVEVRNFSDSWQDGLALCAIIHHHRPDLLDWASLPKDDRHACTELAFNVAAESLDIPRLLEVADLCDSDKPDERSVITYVAQFFHAFSSMDKAEAEARRVTNFVENLKSVWSAMNEYERKVASLMGSIEAHVGSVLVAPLPNRYAEIKAVALQFESFKQTTKRDWVAQRNDVAMLFYNIVTKLRTYNLRQYVAPEGLTLADLDRRWEALLHAEAGRSRSINASLRRVKEELRRSFADAANAFESTLQSVVLRLGALEGTLQLQAEALQAMLPLTNAFRSDLERIRQLEDDCRNANVEENDHTIYTADDLAFEAEEVRKAVTKKIAFVDNQIVSAGMTKLTPAQIEEFETTFRFFDKDESNRLSLPEFSAALASLGIVYSDEDTEQIHTQHTGPDGTWSFEAFIGFLVQITEDTTSPAQVRDSFRGIAGNKSFVTELDLRHALVPQDTIDYLVEAMPTLHGGDGGPAEGFDYEAFLGQLLEQPDDM